MDMFSADAVAIIRHIVKFLYISFDILAPVYITYLVIQIISNWFIFEKAGEKKWKGLIPIYNCYIQAKISWNTKIFCLFLFLQVLIWAYLLEVKVLNWIIPFSTEAEIFSYAVFAIAAIFLLVLTAIAWVRLAQSFGKSKGFAAGLILFNMMFLPILAFGDAEYKGNLYIENKKHKK